MKQPTEELLLDVHERLYEQYVAMEAIKSSADWYSNTHLFGMFVQDTLVSCALDVRGLVPQRDGYLLQNQTVVQNDLSIYNSDEEHLEDAYESSNSTPEEIRILSEIYVQECIDEIIDDDQKI
jgi:hypothetical protein